MASISTITLPNGTVYDLKDAGALQLTGGTVSGPVIFEDAIDIDSAEVGDLVVTGSLSVSNDHIVTIGSASAGTDISADDITSWTSNTPTAVTKKTVVTGGSTTDVPNISKKTVVTDASGATADYSNGVLTITNGTFTTGDSVTEGTVIKAYTSLTTGDSVTVTPGTAASLDYTSRSIPNISVTNTDVLSATSVTTPSAHGVDF